MTPLVKLLLLLLLLLTATQLTGCALSGHLYPVQGPLSTRTPLPIYNISVSRLVSHGPLSATLQDGEVCQGNWTVVSPDDPSANKMSAQWDLVYGQGFFVANVLGSRAFSRAVLKGTQGTTVNVELVAHDVDHLETARGIAQDSQGNLYKLTP
jgi:hypothetical protein